MVNLRTFEISDNLFLGFKRVLDLDNFDNNDQIINEMKKLLHKFLKKENFEILIEKLHEKKFIMPNFADILIKPEYDENNIIYLCSYCHKKHCC